ncbi:hypothetical protein [Stakelama marina]|uniref:Uncharacterized protein n=1 Tax=Stakelama marina TaxID=2826939 RepID=A0A8T4IGN7_9SPHN|nr:hypothetical protein [Stakelama marina]MBR0553757.1 hypothetical protein [Stakelama marina]
MWNDPEWFFTDEPHIMWGRQLRYGKYSNRDMYFIDTPDGRRHATLRRAFASYRAGVDGRGPDNDELEVMRRTLAWINVQRYEMEVVAPGGKCPSKPRGARIDHRRVICDVFGGSPALFESYRRYLQMLGFATPIEKDVFGLTREGQSALIMLELTRRTSPTFIYTQGLFDDQRENRWTTVDPNRWATGLLLPVD